MSYILIGLLLLSLAGGIFAGYERQRVVAANARADLMMEQRDQAYRANETLRVDLAELRKTVENVSVEWGKAHEAELAAQAQAAAALKDAAVIGRAEAAERAVLQATIASPPNVETYAEHCQAAYDGLADLIRASRGLR